MYNHKEMSKCQGLYISNYTISKDLIFNTFFKFKYRVSIMFPRRLEV